MKVYNFEIKRESGKTSYKAITAETLELAEEALEKNPPTNALSYELYEVKEAVPTIDYVTLANGRPLPDEVTFTDWLRVYYNDLDTCYKSAEEKAVSLIIGAILLPAMGIDYEEGETRLDVILSSLWNDITETDYMAGNRTLAMLQEAQEVIEEYQQLAHTITFQFYIANSGKGVIAVPIHAPGVYCTVHSNGHIYWYTGSTVMGAYRVKDGKELPLHRWKEATREEVTQLAPSFIEYYHL